MEYSTKLDTWYRPKPGRTFNGTFAKGCTPYTKGKPQTEWLTAEQRERFAVARQKGWANLEKWRGYNAGHNRKAVVAIATNGKRQYFESIKDAAAATGANERQIYKVLRGTGRTAGGYKWKTDTQHPTPNTK